MLKCEKSAAIVFLGITIFSVQNMHADENRWSTNGPHEAKVTTLAIDPRDSQRIFAGTVENGLYLSTDGGESWSHVDDDTLDKTVYNIEFNPSGPDTMYIATFNGMYRSFDGGLSWGLMRPPGYWYSDYSDIEVHPVHQNIILAGAGLATGYRSTDGGDSWIHLDLPWIAVMDIKTDPLRPDTMYLASQSGHYGFSVMRSEDLGVNWYSVHNDLDSGLVSWDLQIDPTNSDILYLAGSRYPFTDRGICLEKTTDAGNDWFDITPDGLIEYHIWSIAIPPFNSQTLYACTRANGVLKSTDGGNSWSEINNGLSARSVFEMKIDSISCFLYIGTTFHGVFRSTNDGASWEKISENINQAECMDLAVNRRDADTVYVATRGGVYRSSDGCVSWQKVELENPYYFTESHGVEIDPYNPDYIYISYFDHERIGPDGIFRSADGGQTWDTLTSGLAPGGLYRKMAISDLGDGTRRLFLAGIGVYYSDDLGENWQLCGGELPSDYYYWIIEASRVDPELVLTANGREPNLIYRSFDAGNIWAPVSAPPGAGTIITITCDPVNWQIIYVCKNGAGVFKSINCGNSWVDITNNLPRSPDFFTASGIAVNPLNPLNLYVNSQYEGIFVSHDGGQSWEDFNEGLDTQYYEAITIIPESDTNRIYLATYPKSVWSITRTPTAIDDEISPPDDFIALSNYPNPFNAATVFNYTINKSGLITIDIYNLLGQRVETIFDGIQRAGRHSVTWDASAHPSGVYFARLKTADGEKNIKMVLLK